MRFGKIVRAPDGIEGRILIRDTWNTDIVPELEPETGDVEATGGQSMQRITTPDGTIVSYDKYGSGPSLVLVHGAFSDHKTNWEFVKPLFEKQFTNDRLCVPLEELNELRATELWPPIIADAAASLARRPARTERV